MSATITDKTSSLAIPTSVTPAKGDRGFPPRHLESRIADRNQGSNISCVVRRVLMSKRFVPLCLGAGLAIRLLWIVTIPTPPVSDGEWYFHQGMQLAAHQGYTVSDDGFPMGRKGRPLPVSRPTAFWPIGYPAFLSLVFSATAPVMAPLAAAKVANAILSLGIIAATAYCTTVFWQSAVAGRMSLALLAFLPNHVAYTSLITSEIWFTFLLSIGVAQIIVASTQESRLRLVAAGCIFGVAVLTKPQTMLLPALLLLLAKRKAVSLKTFIRELMIVYSVLFVTLLPWTVRNYVAFDRVVFVSNNGGINLLIGNTPGRWQSDGFVFTDRLRQIVRTEKDEVTRDRLARDSAISIVRSQPAAVLLNLPKKLLSLYAFDVDGFGWNRSTAETTTSRWTWRGLRAFSQVYYLMIVVAAVVAVIRFRQSASPYFVIAPAIALYFTLIALVFLGGPRFHFPMMPWLVAQASIVFVSPRPFPATARWRHAAATLGRAAKG